MERTLVKMKISKADATALNEMKETAERLIKGQVRIATFSVRKKDGRVIRTFKIKTIE